ncbi:MAG TPA: RNA methyltransferase substrate-binding domain-containing protein, partial [Arenicellales bacterium]|nr:RNA methyltransferase substrate-binding domain-containing protein [Arenicellales bacterium]
MKRSLVYGIHAVEALIKRNCEQVDEICVYGESRNRRLKGLIAECQRVGLSIRRVERSHLDT